MQNPSSYARYTPVNCWKCGAMNNFAKSQLCRCCGYYLKTDKSDTQSHFGLETDTLFLCLKVISATTVIIFASAFLYNIYLSRLNTNQESGVSFIPNSTIKMPNDSWYQPGISNFYRKYPTIKEIINKNNAVTSKSIKPQDIVSLSLTGTLSFAEAGCYTSTCAERQREIKRAERSRFQNDYSHGYAYSPDIANWGQNRNDLWSIVDEYHKFSFKEVGKAEFYQKKPNKTLEKIIVDPKEATKRTETKKGFNGTNGWKEQITYRSDQMVDVSIENLSPEDLERLKKSSQLMFQSNYNETDLKFSGFSEINQKVSYVIDEKGDDGIESYHFDVVTGLLNKITSKQMIVHLCDYRDFSGVYMPNVLYFRFISEEGMVIWMKLDNINWKFNEPISDVIFEKPTG